MYRTLSLVSYLSLSCLTTVCNGGYGSGLPSFSSNSCDVTVTINPHDKECEIETGDSVWHSVEEMEAEKSEQFQEENAEADPEK